MNLSLEYKSHIEQDPTAPIVFMVHGRAGTRDVMWAFKRCIPEGVTIITPEAPRVDKIGGYSWWDVYGEITNEMIDEGVGKLSSFIDEALSKLNLHPRKIVGLGFSQGAGALSMVMQRRPELFHGVGLLAGFVIKDWASKERSYSALPDIFIAHGTVDEIVPITRTRDGATWLESKGAHVTLVEDEVGHKVGSQGMRELKEWLRTVCLDD